MYDISGNARETVAGTVKRDWIRVVDELRLVESPRYLRHNGRPLLAIWGFGFTDRSPTPAQAVAGNVIETRRLGIEYMPVVYPGISWHNMNRTAPFNPIPRQGGRFYWRQVERALRAGSTTMYGAMFDEVDEGSAMFKVAASRRETPVERPIVTMDADGEPLPSDWYRQLAREGAATVVPSRRATKEGHP